MKTILMAAAMSLSLCAAAAGELDESHLTDKERAIDYEAGETMTFTLSLKNAQSKVYTFEVKCAGPRPVTGWYTVPKKEGRFPATISFHGYGAHFVQAVPTEGPGDRITK